MMRKEGLETFPQKSWYISEFDQDAISNLLGLMSPQSSFITLMSQEEPDGEMKIDPWMNVEYGVREWTEKEVSAFQEGGVIDGVSVPRPNAFIPSSLDILPLSSSKQDSPVKIEDGERGTLFHYRDFEFLVPTSMIKFVIRTPGILILLILLAIRPDNAKSVSLAKLYTRFVSEALNEISYEAGSAGLYVNVGISENVGICISTDGYSTKAMELFDRAVSIMIAKPDLLVEAKFASYKEEIVRSFRNRALDSPLSQGFEKLSSLMKKESCSSKEIADAMELITFAELKAFVENDLYKSTHVQGLCGGNCSESDAKVSWGIINKRLDSVSSLPCSLESVSRAKVNSFDHFTQPLMKEAEYPVSGNALAWVVDATGLSTGVGNETKEISERVLYEVVSRYVVQLLTRKTCARAILF
jgi:insulysin